MKYAMMLCFLLTLHPSGLPAITAEEIRRYQAPGKDGAVIFALDFDRPADTASQYPPGFSISRHEGWNGSHALANTRLSPTEYQVLSLPLPPVPPGQKYTLRYKVRSSGLQKHGKQENNAGIVCIEYRKDGKWHSGDYYKNPPPGPEWQEYTRTFASKADTRLQLTFYLRPEWTGIVYYDDISVATAGTALSIIPTEPRMLTFRLPNCGIRCRLDPMTPPGTVVLAELHQEKHQETLILRPDQSGFISGNFTTLSPGNATLTLILADPKKKQQLYQESFHCQVRPPARPPAEAVQIDRDGTLIVDGKPFMPIGTFGSVTEQDFRRLSEAGFNCVQAYSSLRMRGRQLHQDPLENMRAGLDMAQQYRLKFIFSLKDQLPTNGGLDTLGDASGKLAVTRKIVRALKDHPALLCWYVSDEEPRANVPDILQLRETVAAIDPWHPAWTLTCHYDDLPYYGISGDILGVDPYPIRYDRKSSPIDAITHAMQRGKTTGLPIWAVPQIFNWGAYRLKSAEAFLSSRGPTAEEMQSMTLLFAIHGAKGFIFYSSFDIFERAEKLRPGNAATEWPKVIQCVALLKELEPFLLSKKAPPAMQLRSNPENAAQARGFMTPDGALRVLIVSQKDSRTELQLQLPASWDSLKSRTGKTENQGRGRYLFVSDKVSFDILE